jgi:hypothetical protein
MYSAPQDWERTFFHRHLCEPLVVALVQAPFGLRYARLLQQGGHLIVDELRAIVLG